MPRFKLTGYNSGGYKSSRKITFDGMIEKHYKPDPDRPDTESVISYFLVTHADGRVTEEDNDFLQNLLDTQSYIESFLTIEVEILPEESQGL